MEKLLNHTSDCLKRSRKRLKKVIVQPGDGCYNAFKTKQQVLKLIKMYDGV